MKARRIAIRYFGLTWLAVAMALRFAFDAFQGLYEALWFEGAFPLIRSFQAAVFQWLPLPGYYLMVMLMIAWLVWRFPRKWKVRDTWFTFGRRLLNLLGGLVASFLMLWGYNYLDPGMGARMNLEKSQLEVELAEAYLDVMDRAMAQRGKIPGIDSLPHIEAFEFNIPEAEIALWVQSVLGPLGYPGPAKVSTRYLRPAGSLRRLGIAGIYNPWTGEANVESALGALQSTFTTAHEMAHAFGVSSEAEANFTAYLACLQSGNPLAQYAAEYALWRGLGREVNKAYAAEDIAKLAEAIPEALKNDRMAIWERSTTHRPYFPETSTKMNDSYLKLQGVKAGVSDYNAFVALYFAWQASEGINE